MANQQNNPELGSEVAATEETTAAKTIVTKETANAKAEIESSEVVKKAADKLYAPKKQSFIAQLLDAQKADSTKTNNVVLTFGLPDGSNKTLWIAAGFWDKLQDRFAIDGYVRVESETTEAGKTSYKDQETGNLFYHNNDGERFLGMSRATERMFEKEAPANMGDINLILSAPDAGYAAAIGQYLGNARR